MTPDTLTISVIKIAEVEADCADLTVVIEGAQPFSGQQAFKKAREVQALVTALTAAGIDQAQVKLRSVEMSSGSFAMIRGSSARYGLIVRAVEVDSLPRAISVVALQKGAKLTQLAWQYDTRHVLRKRLRREALSEALQQAREEAALLNVALLAIHKTEDQSTCREFDDFFGRGYRSGVLSDAGLEFDENLKDMTAVTDLGGGAQMLLSLQVTFRIGPLPSERSPTMSAAAT